MDALFVVGWQALSLAVHVNCRTSSSGLHDACLLSVTSTPLCSPNAWETSMTCHETGESDSTDSVAGLLGALRKWSRAACLLAQSWTL